MDNKILFLVNSDAIEFAKKISDKADGYGVYDADSSVIRTMRILINALRYEYDSYNELYKYNSFITDLLGTMLANADKCIYKNEMDVSNIMAKLPFMSILGIQKAIMNNSDNIAVFELVYNEYIENEYEIVMKKTGLKFVDENVEKEDDEKYLLKKIE